MADVAGITDAPMAQAIVMAPTTTDSVCVTVMTVVTSATTVVTLSVHKVDEP